MKDEKKSEKEQETIINKDTVSGGVISGNNLIISSNISPDIHKRITTLNCIQHPQDRNSLATLYDLNAWHKKCILKKRNHICGLGWQMLNDKDNLDDIREFIKRPNPDYSFEELVKRFVEDKLLYGDSYIETIWTKLRPYAFHLPSRDIFVEPVYINRKPSQTIKKFWQIQNNMPLVSWTPYSGQLFVHEVIQHKGYNSYSSYYGVPEYIPILKTIEENYYIQQYNIKFFSNNAEPDYALIITGGQLSTQAEQTIKNYLSNNAKGYKNAHRVMFIAVDNPDVKIELKPLSEIKDASFRLAKASNRDEIIAMHGVPPKLLGVSSPGSLGSGSETLGSMKSYLEEELLPNKHDLEDFLNEQFFMKLFGINPQIKFNTIDLTDQKDDAEIMQRLVSIGAMSPRQVAEDLGIEYDEEYWKEHDAKITTPRNDFGKNPSLVDNSERVE